MEKTLELADPRKDARALSALAPAAAARAQEELERILSSRTFRTAECEKALLRYVVDQMIQGREEEIKEYTVGVEAFGRGDALDPRRSTIVRTEARNVRLRLARYYAGEGRTNPVRIELPKGGYAPRLIEPTPIELTRAPEVPTAPAILEPAPAVPLSSPLSRNWKMILAAASVILMLAAIWFVYQRPRRQWAGGDGASIAVLPFVNLSPSSDKDAQILTDGLTEELIDSLGRIPRLHVVAPSSVFLYKGRTIDVRKAGRDLNVRNVLEGSVRIANGQVRISAQLEDTSNGYQLWSESFDSKLDDAITVQGQISRAIMRSLGSQLAGAANLKTGAAPSPAAYKDFLRGIYYLNRGTAENVKMSISYFEQAVAADPNFAPAYRGLANGYSRIAGLTSTPSGEVIPKMRAAASRALELDDTLGEAHLDLARAYTYESNWADAEREYRRALDLSPGSATVHQHYGFYLIQTGRPEEALAQIRIALELDPISPSTYQFAGRMLYFLRRYDEAIAVLQKGIELDPSSGILHQALGLVYLARPSSYAQGLAETERARELMEGDPFTASQLGYAWALGGKTAEARDILRQVEKGSGGYSGSYVRALAVARVYAGLADRDQAFLWLQKAVDQRDVALSLQADPIYDGLRADPRFPALLRQVNRNASGSTVISAR